MLASFRSVMPKCETAAWASCPSTVSVLVGPAALLSEVLGSVFALLSSTQIPASCSLGLVMFCCVPEELVWKYWACTPAHAVPPTCWRKSAMYLPAPFGSHDSVPLKEPSV